MSKTKIYTKGGDKGTTSLWSGKRVAKSHPRLHAYGSIDELNSLVGIIQSHLNQQKESRLNDLQQNLLEIQNVLFLLGSYISCDDTSLLKHLPMLSERFSKNLEVAIDTMDAKLPPLSNFILPNGHIASANLQFARCICRRAERAFMEVYEEVNEAEKILIYLNRLSDFLFVAARYVNHILEVKDVIWTKDLLEE